MYPFSLPEARQSGMGRSVAVQMVSRAMTEQIKGSFDSQFPGMSESEKWQRAGEAAKTLALSQKEQFNETVKRVSRNVSPTLPRASTRRYLLEADPYHFLYLTKQIEETGRMSAQFKEGKYFNPMMHAPKGEWPAFLIHPYAGFIWYRALRLANPKIEMMEALGFFPVFLCVLVTLAFFWLTRILEKGVLASFAGALTLLLSPVFIQRSAFGWYDTDPYNYLFPILILAVFFWGIGKANRPVLAGVGSAFLTGMYSLFWAGWPLMLLILPASVLPALGILKLPGPFKDSEISGRAGKFVLSFIFFSIPAAFIFRTPAGFLSSLTYGWETLLKFSRAEFDLWPSAFLTVGESQGITVKKLIFLTANYVTFTVALAGAVAALFKAWRSRDARQFFDWVFLSAFAFPFFVLALKTERFSLLFVLPLCFFVMWGIEALGAIFKTLLERGLARTRFFKIAGLAAALPVLVLFLPMPLLTAHIVSLGIEPIMNDTWFEALHEIKQKTPEDAIINSWWPPGYFISAIAARPVTFDGGTQHLRDTYWMARALVTENERECAGILRMLNTGNNGALELLESRGMEAPEAVALLKEIVTLGRSKARQRLAEVLDAEESKKLLLLTHGQNDLRPTYLFLYNDLIEQNPVVTVMAQWDFQKARQMRQNMKEEPFFKLGKKPMTYLDRVLEISGGFLQYTPEAGVEKNENDILFFTNGLRVNQISQEAYIVLPEKKTAVKPMSLLYGDGDQFIEKRYSGPYANVSALLFEDGPEIKSVLADPKLIRSMMFRMYYAGGKGLKLFRPIFSKKDPVSQTALMLYELDREALKVLEASEA